MTLQDNAKKQIQLGQLIDRYAEDENLKPGEPGTVESLFNVPVLPRRSPWDERDDGSKAMRRGLDGNDGTQGEAGTTGATGPQGPKGDKGDPGDVFPSGGEPGMVLTRTSSGYEWDWVRAVEI